MEQEKNANTADHDLFSVIWDPRIERNKLYSLEEVIVITILATIAMAQAGCIVTIDAMGCQYKIAGQ